MSTLQVDKITPYLSASVTIEGSVIQANAATTGSNTFVGNQTVQGDITANRLTLLGGAGLDLIVTGAIDASVISRAPVFRTTDTGYDTYVQVGSPAVEFLSNLTTDNFGFTLDSATYGVSGWSGPSIYGNDSGDNYPAFIGFQNVANYTDGRITMLRNTDVSGSINITEVMQLTQKDPLPAGGVGQLAVSASNLYYHNGSSWSQIN